MAKPQGRKSPHRTADGYAYLTKRIIQSKASAAGRIASKEAMERMGYVIIARGKWIVRKNQDGSIEKLKPIES